MIFLKSLLKVLIIVVLFIGTLLDIGKSGEIHLLENSVLDDRGCIQNAYEGMQY